MGELIQFIFGSETQLDAQGLVAFFCFITVCELLGSLIGSLISAARGR